MPTSVLRRYTPPTCTLEITAIGSSLSRWSSRPVLKNLRFQLSFDDPQLLPEQQVKVRGDRPELEALGEVVETYVQRLLDLSPAQLDASLFQPTEMSSEAIAAHFFPVRPVDQAHHAIDPDRAVDPPLPEIATSSDETATPDAYSSADAFLSELEAEELPISSTNGTTRLLDPRTSATGIYLQPKGLLSHELHLGSLATEETGSVVQLSTLQLFDLANALDEYTAEALAIPTLNRPAWLRSPNNMLRAAAVMLLAFGVTASIAQFIDGTATMQTSAPTDSQTASSADQQFSASAPAFPRSGPESETALTTPFDLETLPPPPPLGQTEPPPNFDFPSVGVPGTAPVAPGGGGQSIQIPDAPSAATAPAPAPPSPVQPSAPSTSIPTEPAPSIARVAPLPELEQASPEVFAIPDETALSRSALPENVAPPQGDSGAGRPAGTIFDTIPQVAEVRDYFQENWQPPEGLNQTLEYRLVLNPDGTLQRIVPLGPTAGDFVDRTEIPLLNEPFVSPVPGGRTAQIRLVLGVDGRVQTFLESVD